MVLPLDVLVQNSIDIVRKNREPVKVQHRYRMPEFTLDEAEVRWSNWSGWREGPVRSRIDGWEYEERSLYVL